MLFTPQFINRGAAFPLAGAAVDLDFRRGLYYPSSISPDAASPSDLLSCSRASIGYAQTVAGTLTQFAANQLRITDLGLLVEDARTNLQPHSQDLSVLSVEKITVTDNQTTAPDGTSTASNLVEDNTAGRHIAYAVPGYGPTIGNGVVYVYSIYLKQGTGRRWAGINIHDGGGVNLASAVIDLQTGSITQTAGSNYTSSSSETLGSGWYRLILVLTGNGTSAGGENSDIFPADSATPTLSQGAATYTGDGSSFFYAWGKQIEAGAFASSYIPTTTAAATRPMDLVTATGTLASVATGTPGSASVDTILINGANASLNYWGILGSTSTKELIGVNFNSDSTALTYDGTNLLTAALGNSRLFSTGVKVAVGWDGSGRSLVGGGGTVASDGNPAIPDPLVVGFRSSGGVPAYHGYIRRLTAWTSRLADATLQSLTAP